MSEVNRKSHQKWLEGTKKILENVAAEGELMVSERDAAVARCEALESSFIQANSKANAAMPAITSLTERCDRLEVEIRSLKAERDDLRDKLALATEHVSMAQGDPLQLVGQENASVIANRAAAITAFGDDHDKANYLRLRGWVQREHGGWDHPGLKLETVVFQTAVDRQIMRDVEPFKHLAAGWRRKMVG